MKCLNVRVLKDDIKDAVKGSTTSCPIARALIRMYGTKNVSVGNSHIVVDGISFPTPVEAGIFISLFDSGEYVVPFDFEAEKKA